MLQRAYRVALAVGLLAAAASAQTLWTVAWPPCANADFIQVQDAIDAAADGDVIHAIGSFSNTLVIDGKALTIVSEGVNAEPFEIRNLAPDQSVVIRGLNSGRYLRVRDCAGPVFIEDSTLRFTLPYNEPTVLVENSASVTFSRVTVPASPVGGGLPGLHVVDSDVALLESSITGQDGSDSSGGSGARVQGASRLVAQGSVITGGDGDLVCDSFGYCIAQGGGDGIEVTEAASQLWLFQSEPQGGEGETGGEFGPAPDGVPIDVDDRASQVVELPGAARHFDVTPAAANEGEYVTLHVEAQPGDLTVLFVGGGGAPLWDPRLGGTVLPLMELLVLPVAGRADLPYLITDDLTFPGAPLVVTLQPLFVAASSVSAGAASYLTILDGLDTLCP